MEVSIGIMAYNEEKNIGRLLNSILNQKLKCQKYSSSLVDQRTKSAIHYRKRNISEHAQEPLVHDGMACKASPSMPPVSEERFLTKIKIKEIIIVSSGSADKTNENVEDFSRKNKKIRLIIQKKREGKFSAINEFLMVAKSKILILLSGDIFLRVDAIERLCIPLFKKDIGIVASRPIPIIKRRKLIDKIIESQWLLHHEISLKNPKFGEAIAFRKVFKKLDKTAVDEEHIAMLIKKQGFKFVYSPDAIVYNQGPLTIIDLLKQRRRIYCGHLELKKKFDYEVPTLGNFYVFGVLLNKVKIKNIFPLIFAMLLEGYGRLLGLYDLYRNKKHHVWVVGKKKK